MRARRSLAFLAASIGSGLLLLPVSAATTWLVAQNLDSLRQSYLLALPPAIEVVREAAVASQAARVSPASSDGTPIAYGAEWGDGFFGLGFQNRMRYVKTLPRSQQMDGSVVAGFGLGDAESVIGIETAITSFSTVRSGFGNHMGVSFKIHRLLPKNIGVAIGWEDAIRSQALDGGSSIYGVVSSFIPLRKDVASPLGSVTVSAGIGDGRFQTERAISLGKDGVNGFGSLGVRILSPVSLIAEWGGQDLTVAASIVPFVRFPLVISPGFADVTGSAGDGARFTVGVGLGFSFGQLFDSSTSNRTGQ
ncbi:MAG TPA: hypothetical protein DEV93_10495 [Chloroflexi bacterium]|nr:hypothetical protein [Chloroflexota bacterium]